MTPFPLSEMDGEGLKSGVTLTDEMMILVTESRQNLSARWSTATQRLTDSVLGSKTVLNAL